MAVKFETNIPLTLRFLYGDHKEVDGHYGQQFMYAVEIDGLRDRLYAAPGLHHKLQGAGVCAGSKFTITKIEIDGNRKDWTVEAETRGLNGKEIVLEVAHSSGKTSHANGHSSEVTTLETESEEPPLEVSDFERMRRAMGCCLRAAYGAWEGLGVEIPFTPEDLRAVAITLFLECSRKGIVPEVAEVGEAF